MNILLVEDDHGIADFLLRGLRSEGHVVTHATRAEEGQRLIARAQPEILILDLVLPDSSGLDLCQRLRTQGCRMPILILSALKELSDRVTGLRVGADVYMSKPFHFDELIAQIDALARYDRKATPESPKTLTIADLELDRDTLTVTRAGQKIALTPKELALLELLMSDPAKVFSRERILATVWGYSHDPQTNIVQVYVRRLRKKVDEGHEQNLIHTARGFGYRISEQPLDANR